MMSPTGAPRRGVHLVPEPAVVDIRDPVTEASHERVPCEAHAPEDPLGGHVDEVNGAAESSGIVAHDSDDRVARVLGEEDSIADARYRVVRVRALELHPDGRSSSEGVDTDDATGDRG